jgi:hypothetical protein
VEVVGGARLELGDEVKVEVASLGRLCVNEQAAAADVGGELAESGDTS